MRRTPSVIKQDPADDHFLACATAGKADAIVSGGHHLLDLAKYEGIPILNVKTFINSLARGAGHSS